MSRKVLLAFLLIGISALVPSSALAAYTYPGKNGTIAALLNQKTLGTFGPKKFKVLDQEHGRGNFYDNPSFSRDGKKIVLSEYFGAPWSDLAVVDASSGQVNRISTHKLSATFPTFLSDGRILFSGHGYSDDNRDGVYVVRRDGSGQHRLFAGFQFAATPDAGHFVGWDKSGFGRKLLLLNAKGKRVNVIASVRNRENSLNGPAFSPNGRKIVYSRIFRSKGKATSDLFIVGRDGRRRRQLTSGMYAVEPSFSPDGRKIIFTVGNGITAGPSNVAVLNLRHPGKIKYLTHAKTGMFNFPIWARQ